MPIEKIKTYRLIRAKPLYQKSLRVYISPHHEREKRNKYKEKTKEDKNI